MATPNTRTLDNRSGLDTEATRRAAELAERLHCLVTEHGTPRRMSWGKGFQTVLQCTEGRLTVRLFHNNRFLAAYWHAEGEAPSPENQVFLAKAGLPRGGTTYTIKREAGYEAVCERLLPIGRVKPTFTPPRLLSVGSALSTDPVLSTTLYELACRSAHTALVEHESKRRRTRLALICRERADELRRQHGLRVPAAVRYDTLADLLEREATAGVPLD